MNDATIKRPYRAPVLTSWNDLGQGLRRWIGRQASATQRDLPAMAEQPSVEAVRMAMARYCAGTGQQQIAHGLWNSRRADQVTGYQALLRALEAAPAVQWSDAPVPSYQLFASSWVSGLYLAWAIGMYGCGFFKGRNDDRPLLCHSLRNVASGLINVTTYHISTLMIAVAVQACNDDHQAAARLLGVSPPTIAGRLRQPQRWQPPLSREGPRRVTDEAIASALRGCNFDQSAAARQLGIRRQAIGFRLEHAVCDSVLRSEALLTGLAARRAMLDARKRA